MPDMGIANQQEGIKLHGLHLEGPFSGGRLTGFSMYLAPGEHAYALVQTQIRLSEAKEWIYQELNGIPAAVKGSDDDILFCGPIANAAMRVKGGSCYVELKLTSGSTFLDLNAASCSYQDGSLSYRQIMKETIQEIAGGAIIFPGVGDETTGQPIIRYLETAWEFLARLASHRNVPLIPDIYTTGAARIFAGLPKLPEAPVMWSDWQVINVHQDGRFLRLGGYEAGLDPQYFLMYDIVDSRIFQIGQRGMIRGREMQVVGVEAVSEAGRVIFTYHVAVEQYCFIPRLYNRKLSGMSLLGTVIRRAAEDLWLHLDIDGGRSSTDNWGWPWTPPTGNFMYLMPKEGSRVSLYFSNDDERSGRGINCIAQGGGNPKERWLRTEHKKSLNMLQDELSLVSENGGNSLSMRQSNVNLKGLGISISGVTVNIKGANLYLISKGGSILMGSGALETSKTGEVKLDPTAFMGLSSGNCEIYGESSAILRATGTKRNEPYPDGPEEGAFNWGKAAGRAAVAVVVVGGSAVLICATMGASAPVIGTAAATGVLAGGSLVVSDAVRGQVSSLEDYALAVAGAELMFFTNMAATKLISATGMGFFSGTLLKAGADTAAQATMDYLIEGEVDRERMARNLLITFTMDLTLGLASGEANRGRGVEGGSGAEGNKILLSGDEWYRYFQETYGVENVNWNVNSFDDIMRHPTSLSGYTADEIADILGDGWIRGTYGSNGSGWKFIEKAHPDNMVFFHGGGGYHEGAYYGISFGGKNGGRIKIVDINTYVPDVKDDAFIIYSEDW